MSVILKIYKNIEKEKKEKVQMHKRMKNLNNGWKT